MLGQVWAFRDACNAESEATKSLSDSSGNHKLLRKGRGKGSTLGVWKHVEHVEQAETKFAEQLRTDHKAYSWEWPQPEGVSRSAKYVGCMVYGTRLDCLLPSHSLIHVNPWFLVTMQSYMASIHVFHVTTPAPGPILPKGVSVSAKCVGWCCVLGSTACCLLIP